MPRKTRQQCSPRSLERVRSTVEMNRQKTSTTSFTQGQERHKNAQKNPFPPWQSREQKRLLAEVASSHAVRSDIIDRPDAKITQQASTLSQSILESVAPRFFISRSFRLCPAQTSTTADIGQHFWRKGGLLCGI
mmetsp:Transcript_26251/g.77623  ORF Transcript_26251/g.77623 Transcript_26251/m.77623 type:complete len:134 (+) Transcript_26251:74-475(+)